MSNLNVNRIYSPSRFIHEDETSISRPNSRPSSRPNSRPLSRSHSAKSKYEESIYSRSHTPDPESDNEGSLDEYYPKSRNLNTLF
jgi:hypothetical protein